MNTGDNAWVLVSSALVLLMTPGLAMFYGGLTRARNVLSTMMQSFVLMGLATMVWMLWGFSLAFAPDAWRGLIGGTNYLFLDGVGKELWGGTTIPGGTFMIFQCMFAILTPALISGAFAERMKFTAFLVFMVLWLTFVYCPVCHWVWGPGGWLVKMGILDYAGGTVVHVNSGMAGLACALTIGERTGYGEKPMPPCNLPMTLIGAGLLWFGWFGFNAGSALAANATATMAFVATQMATAAACLSWTLFEWMIKGKPTVLGAASGAIAGLVAVTPAAGFVTPACASIIGALAGVLCYLAVVAKNWLGYDDSLDVVGIHAAGGAWGALATGLFASEAMGGVNGALYGAGEQVWPQLAGVVATAVYSFAVTAIIIVVVEITVGVRVNEEVEEQGLDVALHGERGYNLS
jgi:ammonium transporter, Amt family